MQETRQDLVEQAEARPRPLLAFRDALQLIELKHEVFLSRMEALTNARIDLERAKTAAGNAYLAAVEAAKNIDERLPEKFRIGELDMHFDMEGDVTVKHVPAAEAWDLIKLAKKAGEQE